ncbi:MAG: DNA polymerase III subunit beta [Candidatus Wildermuthbacteria bacterium]|nr:DNA polymerase III subunit beta [Candidatus Wildermuthbacteria bacterium]
MKSTVLKNNLKEALGFVERIAAKSPTLPILSNIFISAEKNFLELTSTDLEIGIRYYVLSKNEKPGKTVVPAKFLSQFISLLPEEQITLDLQDNGLHIQSKGYTTLVKTLNPDDFPIIPSLKGNEESVEIETDALCRGLNQVVGMTGQTQVRPEISGVLFLFEKEILKLAATDSFRLAEKTLALKKGQSREGSFIVPQKTVRELIAILGERAGKTIIHISPSQVVFEYAAEDDPSQTHIVLVSRLIEGEYPKYQDVIPSSFAARAMVSKNEFLNHLKAASIFAGKTNDVRVKTDTEREGLELSARNADIGENVSFVKASVKGENNEAAFNWRFLAEGIAQIKSENVELAMNGDEGPTLVRPTKEEGYLYVVMPIKA